MSIRTRPTVFGNAVGNAMGRQILERLEPILTHMGRSHALTSAGETMMVVEAQARRWSSSQFGTLWSSLGLADSKEVQAVAATTEILRGRARDGEQGSWTPGAGTGSPRKTVYWRERGDGPPLVLLNGWSASGIAWPAAWLQRLEDHFRLISVDNRGTGWSRYTDAPYRIADLADDVVAVLDDAGVDRCTVLGLSMGGMIAQEVAMRHPGRVTGLVAVATRPPAPAHLTALPRFTTALLESPRPGVALENHMHTAWMDCCAPGFADPDGALGELIDRIVERVTPRQTLLRQLRAVTMWHGANRLKRLTVPALVVHGDEDRLMAIGNATRVVRLTPDAKYVELKGVGHLVPLEASDRLADLVIDFAGRQGDD